jgi:predicted Rossmann fold flavoprotein
MRSAKNIVIIGGGASGFFCAINLALLQPGHTITILEKTNKLLSKVRVSGGGRCNVTHHCFDNSELIKNYPRGNRELKQVLPRFDVKKTIEWFNQQGVKLKTEDDGRMFPESDSSETIIRCFLQLSEKLNIKVITSCEVFGVKKSDRFHLKTSLGNYNADHVVFCTGGHHKKEAYQVIKNLGHTIIEPIPSLFTFNLPNESIKKLLQGLAVQTAEVKIAESKMKYTGPILITHWGLSGPAVLKLSAFAAENFYKSNYNANILVNWIAPLNAQECEEKIGSFQKDKHKALPYTQPLFEVPRRLWEFLCERSGIDNSRPWAEISRKQIRLLCGNLCNSNFKMEGKTTFKEEFVSCGGVDLKEIDFKTMESKILPGVYFCGEVLNIDGITGGFNFQNAWSTAWICAQSLAK